MRGIDSADGAGLKIKINTVALRDVNEEEFDELILF
jgi:molybdenum cofactor biosynthesis enzyme MoaA